VHIFIAGFIRLASPFRSVVLPAPVSHFAGRLYGMRSHKYKEVVEGVRKLVG